MQNFCYHAKLWLRNIHSSDLGVSHTVGVTRKGDEAPDGRGCVVSIIYCSLHSLCDLGVRGETHPSIVQFALLRMFNNTIYR